MTLDPQIACTRFPAEAGHDFYVNILEHIVERPEQSSGMLMHFTIVRDGEFTSWSVFRDHPTMLEAFLSYSSREAQAEILAQGEAFDITRDEYPLERLVIDPGVATQPLQFAPSAEIAVTTSDVVTGDVEKYRELTAAIGGYDRPVEGRLAHLAYVEPSGRVHALDFWETRAAGAAWYKANANEAFERFYPQTHAADVADASWLALQTFVVTPGADEYGRHFVRE